MRVMLALAVTSFAVLLVAAAHATVAERAPAFDPQHFGRSAAVDNKWLPLKPGTRMTFIGATSEGKKRVPHSIVNTVTDLTKVIGGVRARVVWERDFSDGELVEAELAFFAQDKAGNVWHVGEYPEEYEDGKFVRAPAWLHGLHGARAGLAMSARPHVGMPSYAQGYAPPPVSWTDHAKVRQMGLRVCVPYNCFDDVLVTGEYNPDEPGMQQLKYYAPGVGNVLVGWSGAKDEDKETLALVDLEHLGAGDLAAARRAALKLEGHAYKVSKVYGRTRPAVRG